MIGQLHMHRFRPWWKCQRPMGMDAALGTVSGHLSNGAYSRLRERLYNPWEQSYWFRRVLDRLQHPDEVFPPEHDESI